FPVIHQPPQEMSILDMEDLKQQYLDEMKSIINSKYRNEIKINELKENFNGMSIEINKKKKLQQLEQEATIQVREYYKNSPVAITPGFSITDSLLMEDEHLEIISKTKSDEFIKSSVENLVQNPTEFEDECECDMPDCDDSQTTNFLTFSDPLFDYSTSSDDESSHEEVIHEMSFKTYSNPLFDLDEEIISRINEANCDHEEDIHLVERFLYDNSSPHPSKEFNYDNSDAIIESFSPSPITVEDSDSLIEEIDIFLASDDSMPSGIENDDYDSEGDILFLEELLSNDSPSLPKNELFHFDVPSSPRPLAKPLGDDEIEPDTRVLTTKVVGDISEHYVLMPRLLPTQPTLCPVNDTLLPFSSKNEDKVHLLSHRSFKASQLIFYFSKSPMMIYGGDSPTLDVLFLHFYPP
nr:hypothetical protein [Tanacetum cinerariifolium]